MTPRFALATACVAIIAGASPAEARGEPLRILVAAGSQQGLDEEAPLKHADADASHVGEVMTSLGGVRRENAIVLAEPSRAQLYAAIDRARAMAAGRAPEEVTLLFYFSGHGDRDALHLGGDRVLLSDLTAKLGEVPAALRIAVTDACRTNRAKGFAPDEPFAIASTTGPQATGQVWIHASREGEAAQESDELAGAIFTHAWLDGLRGAADANGDARVTLEESFAFAHAQTLIRSSRSSGVVQKPEAIVNLREAGPVVLTQTTEHVATLALPKGRDTHFLVYAADSKSVLSELWGLPERPIALAVPAGHYVVQRRLAGLSGVARVSLAEGEGRTLTDRDFRASSLDAVASKGTADATSTPAPTARRNEIAAGYVAGADTRSGFVQGARADYAFAWPRAALTIGAEGDVASRSLPSNRERLVTGLARATLEWRVPVGPVVLRLGGGGRAGWLSQQLESPAGSSSAHGAFVGGPEIFAALRAKAGSTFFADVGATGDVLFLRESDALRGVTGVLGGGALGASF